MFCGTFELNWHCNHWADPDTDRVVFFRYFLVHNSDVPHYYDGIINAAKETSTPMRWSYLCELFAARYSSFSKQTAISNRLESLRLNDVREAGDDNYAALDKPTTMINQLCPMARVKDRDDEAKVRFLSRAVIGTAWGLSALQRIPSKLPY